MVVLGLANSRMKDFYDVWVLSSPQHTSAPRFSISFPVVVTSAPLFACSIDEAGATQLSEIDGVSALFSKGFAIFRLFAWLWLPRRGLNRYIEDCKAVTSELQAIFAPAVEKEVDGNQGSHGRSRAHLGATIVTFLILSESGPTWASFKAAHGRLSVMISFSVLGAGIRSNKPVHVIGQTVVAVFREPTCYTAPTIFDRRPGLDQFALSGLGAGCCFSEVRRRRPQLVLADTWSRRAGRRDGCLPC